MPVNRRIPSYRKHSTRNHAIVKIEGKVHDLGPYGSSESRELYDELVAAYLERRCDDDPVLVVEVLAKFWAHANHRRQVREASGNPPIHVATAGRANSEQFDRVANRRRVELPQCSEIKTR